jgi:hypothetical protein
VASNYFSADPVSFKRKRRQHTTEGRYNNFLFTSIAHDSSASHDFKQTRQQEEHKLTQELGEPTKEYSSDSSVNTKSSKIDEIKSLCKSLFSPTLRDTVFQNIQLDIKQEGNESRLDDYLSLMRSWKACFQLGPEVSEKPGTWKLFHNSHPSMFDLPLEAKKKLSEIERLMLHSSDDVTVWEEIERLGKKFRITGDYNVLNLALDYYHGMATS